MQKDLIARLRAGTVTPADLDAAADALEWRVKVRELVWDKITSASFRADSVIGRYYVYLTADHTWRAYREQGPQWSSGDCPTETAAKAAAQADYAARIMAAIEVVG